MSKNRETIQKLRERIVGNRPLCTETEEALNYAVHALRTSAASIQADTESDLLTKSFVKPYLNAANTIEISFESLAEKGAEHYHENSKSVETINEWRRAINENRRLLFFTAAFGCIGYAIDKATRFNFQSASLWAALIIWAASLAFGCLSMYSQEKSMIYNQLLLKSSTVTESNEFFGLAGDHFIKSYKFGLLQFAMLIAGAVAFVSWRILLIYKF